MWTERAPILLLHRNTLKDKGLRKQPGTRVNKISQQTRPQELPNTFTLLIPQLGTLSFKQHLKHHTDAHLRDLVHLSVRSRLYQTRSMKIPPNAPSNLFSSLPNLFNFSDPHLPEHICPTSTHEPLPQYIAHQSPPRTNPMHPKKVYQIQRITRPAQIHHSPHSLQIPQSLSSLHPHSLAPPSSPLPDPPISPDNNNAKQPTLPYRIP